MAVQVEVVKGVNVVTVSGSLGYRIPDALNTTIGLLARTVQKLVIVIDASAAAEASAVNPVLRSLPTLAEHSVRCIWVVPHASYLDQQLQQAGVSDLFLRAISREAAINSLL